MDGLSHWFKKGIGVAIVFLLWPGMAFGIPVCQVSRVIPGPPLRVEFTIQESKIGVKAINVIEKINASVQMTPFPPGFINPVVVTATKGNSTEALKVTLQAVDMKGGVSTCQYQETVSPPVDTDPPTCFISEENAGPPAWAKIVVQDVGSGLQLIAVMEQSNATVTIPNFQQGTTGPVEVLVSQSIPNLAFSVVLQAKDMRGNPSTCQYEEEVPPPVDPDPPTCFISEEHSEPPAWLKIEFQDVGSGLQSIVVMEQSNTTVTIPDFQQGTIDPVEVLVSQSIPNLAFSVVFQVTDISGNLSTCTYPPVSFTKTRPEFDAVGKDSANAFSDFYKTLVIQHGLDNAGRAINDLSAFALESFTTNAGTLTPDSCFSSPGKTYLSVLTPTWTEAFYEWKITLQMRPASDISVNLIGCILKAGQSDPWTNARQTGLYRTPWPTEEPVFLPPANPKVTVRAFPGPFAVLGFPQTGFYLDARTQPGLNVSPLMNSEFTLQSLLEETLLLVVPITGHRNALGETMYELSQGDRLSITVEIPYNSTADIRFGKDNAVVKYLGFVGTEYITGP